MTTSWLRTLALGTFVLSLLALPQTASAEDLGRCKVHRINKAAIVGDVKLEGDTYVIEVRGDRGAKRIERIPKTQVTRVEKLDAADATASEAGAPAAAGSTRAGITSAMIEQILGSEHVEISSLDAEDFEVIDFSVELPDDNPSVQEMLRIAGPKAKVHKTAHFVFVYTSDKDSAARLAARLESVYSWNLKYAERFKIPIHVPKAKLEIFYFGTFEEYDAYQTINGFRSGGAIGFYTWTNNRSAFFNMLTYPPYKNLLDRVNDANMDGREKLRIRNYIDRRVEHENLEVVQHEAAHHIHFNLGIFSALARPPRWMSEGLATIFECPPTKFGASFGVVNYYRLYHFRRAFGERGERLPDFRFIMFDDRWFFGVGFYAYAFGWAMNHYLIREYPDKYARWMQLLATRDIGSDWETADRQKAFEEIFGEVDDAFRKRFLDWVAAIELKTEELPPD